MPSRPARSTRSTRPVRPAAAPRAQTAPPLPPLGAHMSVAGGLANAIDRALSVGADAVQIFVKNNMQWFAKPLAPAEAEAWNAHPQRKSIRAAIGHTGYLLNLAATNPDFHARSLRSLHEELVRAGQIHLPFLVLHPGAHMGAGESAGLQRVAESLDRVFDALPDHPVRIALETTAGQGTCLGHTFGHLRDLLGAVREPRRLCVCLDTAHVFAAGYDLSTEEATLATLAEFDRVVGLRHLVALHLNDSKAARGSRVDRHEAIGRGKIGLPAFRAVLTHPKLRHLPMLLETPKGPDLKEDRANLATLRGLIATTTVVIGSGASSAVAGRGEPGARGTRIGRAGRTGSPPPSTTESHLAPHHF